MKNIDNRKKEEIKKLLKNKQFDLLFKMYGKRIYCSVTKEKYKKKDIKRLIEQGRFEDIYRKYGIDAYNRYIPKMMEMDTYFETGKKPQSKINKIKMKIRYKVIPFILGTSMALPVGTIGLDLAVRELKYENYLKNLEEIEKYDKKIKEYAKKIKQMNLTDIQLFMKLMDDLWNEIEGYESPDDDIFGLYRIALSKENKGVCRNFADDLTAKLNEIDNEYNARNLIVYIDLNLEYNLANIERNILEKDETNEYNNANEVNDEENEQNIFIPFPLTYNHMVTVVDIKGKNLSLILDPTNPSIGFFKDGKIYMFSREDGQGMKVCNGAEFFFDGFDSAVNIAIRELKSILPCEYSIEEMEKEWGVKAQNDALEYCRKNKARKEFVPKVSINNENISKEENNNTKFGENEIR